MSKAEKIFWVVLIFVTGIVMGVIVQILVSPAKATPSCEDGHSTQVENGTIYKTYVPALDNCNK